MSLRFKVALMFWILWEWSGPPSPFGLLPDYASSSPYLWNFLNNLNFSRNLNSLIKIQRQFHINCSFELRCGSYSTCEKYMVLLKHQKIKLCIFSVFLTFHFQIFTTFFSCHVSKRNELFIDVKKNT